MCYCDAALKIDFNFLQPNSVSCIAFHVNIYSSTIFFKGVFHSWWFPIFNHFPKFRDRHPLLSILTISESRIKLIK